MNASSADQIRSHSRATTRWLRWTACCCLLVLAGCATNFKVPPLLQVPSGQKLFLHAYAKGVQVYVCDSSAAEPDQFAWRLKAPEAMLFDACGNVIGSHFSGPTWQSARDESRVTGDVLQRCPSPDSNAIPWLLLKAKATEPTGQFHAVTFIQRVNTTGGLAPTTAPTESGQEARATYTAEYYFYRVKRRCLLLNHDALARNPCYPFQFSGLARSERNIQARSVW